MTFTAFDHHCMARAMQLAKKGWYTTHPNPRVGCVIARHGVIVGEGYHRRAGEGHAEVNALADAGEQAKGATAYVTLEPCNHDGRTGPCSRALIAAGVTEVVYGMADPHKTASGGIGTLLAEGIAVRGPLLETEARALNPGFIQRCETGTPRVTLKLAMSLDGRTAMANGESQWITGPAARADVQRLRAASGAIVTGIGTVLDDDPSMNVRDASLGFVDGDHTVVRQPLRVIVDSALRTPATARMLALEGDTLIATALPEAQFRSDFPPGVQQLSLPGSDRVDLVALLAVLAERECSEVLVEAGPTLSAAFVRAGLVDRVVIYMAGKLMGSTARPLLELPLEHMADARKLKIQDIRAVGDDWRITAITEK